MLPSVPIFPVYNFFRQNIWYSIFDQFHFHHIFGDEITVSSDKTGQSTNRPPFWFLTCPLFGDQLNGYQRKELQIFASTTGKSTNIYIFQIWISQWRGRLWNKLFWGFFWQWSHLSFPKISTFTDCPFTFFAYIPKIFDKYQMLIFFIEYLGSLRPVRTWLMYIWSKLSKN